MADIEEVSLGLPEDEELLEENPDNIIQVLEWISVTDTHITDIQENFKTFDELSQLTAKDITALIDNFRRRTKPGERYVMPLTVQKRLKFTIDWLHDFERVNKAPSLEGLTEDSFRAALKVAGERAPVIRDQESQSNTISKEAAPGPLKGEKDWIRWSEALENQLNTLYGTLGVPLAYVIRETEILDPGIAYSNFVEECIARAPLEGTKFEADTRQVHRAILSSTQGQPSHEWIKPLMRKTNGRLDMIALRSHYQGKGNTTRRIAEVVRLRDSLQYRNERGLPFASYLSKMQQMFTLFSDNDEPYTDAMKTRFLYDSIQHSQLMTTVSTLQVGQIAGNVVSFSDACGHLATVVSKFPESQVTKRNIAGLETGGNRAGRRNSSQPHDLDGICTADGKIYTGYYSNFFSLPSADQAAVKAERARTNHPKGNKRSKGQYNVKAVKKMKVQMKAQAATIAAMKRLPADDDIKDDAGDSFGGRKEKKKSKSKSQNRDSDSALTGLPFSSLPFNIIMAIIFYLRQKKGQPVLTHLQLYVIQASTSANDRKSWSHQYDHAWENGA